VKAAGPAGRRPDIRSLVQENALIVLLGAGVFALALDGGGYGVTTRNSLAIGIWWALALAIALVIWPLARLPRAAVVAGGLLAGFTAWTALSIAWSDSAEKAFAEFDRVSLYLGVFLLVVVAAARGGARRWSDGLAIGIVATALLALTSRLLPHLVGGDDVFRFLPGAESRLSYPVDYWNGLAIFVALGFPLVLRVATYARAHVARGLAVASIPAMVGVIYLTSSRGGAAAALVGTLVFLALSGRRLAALGALGCSSVGAALVVGVLEARPKLVDGPLGSAAAISQGKSAAPLILLACALTGIAYALASRYLRPPRARVGRKAKLGLALACVAAVAAGTVAADPVKRFDTFKAVPSKQDALRGSYTQAHLLSGGGSGRWQFWQAAVDEFQTRPLTGRGAGSYEAWWTRHASFSYFVRDAHSLYVETLGELGLIGFALLILFLGSGAAAAAFRLRGAGTAERASIAALAGVLAAYALGAGIDWMWELTVVSVVGIASLALLVGPATMAAPRQALTASDVAEDGSRRGARRATSRALPRAVIVVAALGLIGCQLVPLLAHANIRQSQQAAAKGDAAAALSDALQAKSLQPWAASPYLQIALVQEQSGNLAAARTAIRSAIGKDRSDWRLFLVSARLEVKAGRIAEARRSLRRAERLNPKSPLFARQ
jgi:O-antigen ligase